MAVGTTTRGETRSWPVPWRGRASRGTGPGRRSLRTWPAAVPEEGREDMARSRNTSHTRATSGATVGYEAQLWQMADALRGSMDAAEYKHVVLGLIFLKYISDAFEEQHARLVAEQASGADPEDPDEYRAVNVFWVPPESRWTHLKARAKQPTIGQLVDDAMAAIERDNPALKDVLPKDYLPAPQTRQAGGEKNAGEYADGPGFCKSATLEEIRKHGHVLTPGRYVGAEAQEDDGEPFEEKMKRLVAQLREQQAEALRLDAAIAANLRELGFWKNPS